VQFSLRKREEAEEIDEEEGEKAPVRKKDRRQMQEGEKTARKAQMTSSSQTTPDAPVANFFIAIYEWRADFFVELKKFIVTLTKGRHLIAHSGRAEYNIFKRFSIPTDHLVDVSHLLHYFDSKVDPNIEVSLSYNNAYWFNGCFLEKEPWLRFFRWDKEIRRGHVGGLKQRYFKAQCYAVTDAQQAAAILDRMISSLHAQGQYTRVEVCRQLHWYHTTLRPIVEQTTYKGSPLHSWVEEAK
jgi:hypothetical protein